jgi:single-strand DNA-binding protein
MAKVVGIVRLGQEPKMDFTPKGMARTQMSVAIRSGFGDKEKTTWARLTAFGSKAELLNEKISKGDRLSIVAEFQEIQMFEKKDGSTGISLELLLDSFEFVDKANKTTGTEPEEF